MCPSTRACRLHVGRRRVPLITANHYSPSQPVAWPSLPTVAYQLLDGADMVVMDELGVDRSSKTRIAAARGSS